MTASRRLARSRCCWRLLRCLYSRRACSRCRRSRRRGDDLTGTLTAAQRATLEQKLSAFEQRKGSQVAVLIVPTTEPEDIAQYSMRVVDQWKLGRGKVNGKRVDDGALLLVAKNDRRMRIEVGYGLEGVLTGRHLQPHHRGNHLAAVPPG